MREFDPEADHLQRCHTRALHLSLELGCLPGDLDLTPPDEDTPVNYIDLAMRTNSPSTGTHGVSADLLHATLGLCDEHFEYHASSSWLNAGEELGDLCWFIALAAHDLGCDPFDNPAVLLAHSPELPLLQSAIAEFVGAVKKAYAYGKPLPKERLRFLLHAMATRIEVLAEKRVQRTLDELLAANIEKLRARFPEKFEEHLAIVRNIKQEGAALRGELH